MDAKKNNANNKRLALHLVKIEDIHKTFMMIERWVIIIEEITITIWSRPLPPPISKPSRKFHTVCDMTSECSPETILIQATTLMLRGDSFVNQGLGRPFCYLGGLWILRDLGRHGRAFQ